jgi:penicillin V acylase-like amidase (Ntn superfamily)
MKKIESLANVFLASLLTVSSVGNSFACTALMIMDKSGNAYQARTNEMSVKLPTSLTYIPAGEKVQSFTPVGGAGKSFKTLYPILGMTMGGTLPNVPGKDHLIFLDGVNDQGLSLSANEFDNSKAPPLSGDSSKTLMATELAHWILGSFKSVAEAKDALLSNQVEIWLPVVPGFNAPLPLHYALFDKTGAGIVVEFANGKLNVYDNLVGVMTNGPEFPWHITNMNNYSQLSNIDHDENQFNKLKVRSPDDGNGTSGLPSTSTSPGRFVKAAYYSNYVTKADTPDQAIINLSHVMANFDRPTGVNKEVTNWIVMNDLNRHRFYTRSIDSLNWVVIDFAQLKGVSQIKSVSNYEIDKTKADAFTLFLK